MANSNDLDSIIEQIACQSMLNDVDFINADKDKKGILMVNCKGSIREKINEKSSELLKIIPTDLQLPMSVECAVAKQLLIRLDKEKSNSIDSIEIPNSMIYESLNLQVKSIEEGNVVVGLNNGTEPKEFSMMDNDGNVIEKSKEVEAPENLDQIKGETFENASKNAHREDATKEEKETAVALMFSDDLDTFIKAGLIYSQLDTGDKAVIRSVLATYKNNGDIETYNYYVSRLGISEEMLIPNEENTVNLELDTNNPEEDLATKEVNRIAGKVGTLFKYTKYMKPDAIAELEKELDGIIANEELAVDGIFKAISASGVEAPPEMIAKYAKKAIERFNELGEKSELDSCLFSYMVRTIAFMRKNGNEAVAKECYEALQTRMPGKMMFEFEKIDSEFSLCWDEFLYRNSERNSQNPEELFDEFRESFDEIKKSLNRTIQTPSDRVKAAQEDIENGIDITINDLKDTIITKAFKGEEDTILDYLNGYEARYPEVVAEAKAFYNSDEYRTIKSLGNTKLKREVDQTSKKGVRTDILIKDLKSIIVEKAINGEGDKILDYLEEYKNVYPEAVKEVKEFYNSSEYKARIAETKAEKPEKEVVQTARENKKANFLKIMTGMTRSKGLVKSQEWMDKLITNYKDKELIAEAAVEFLEKQKENDEHFRDEDSKEARESVFESIVLSGIDNPEIYERMQKIDRETARSVVDKMLQQINDSRTSINRVLGAVQLLGKGLKEKVEPSVEDKILDASKTELPKVNLLPKENDGWEPAD